MEQTKKKERIFLAAPHMSGYEMEYILEAFETNWITSLGPNVDAFEKEFAAYVGAEGAVALSSGTAAIHLALELLNIGRGDYVFCSSLTFVASANPILYQGAVPVFIDSEPETWNMSPQALEKAFYAAEKSGKMPKAVIIVHLYGQPAKMNELMEICRAYNVPVIEDAAESLGSVYEGKASGTIGDFGVYSFNGNKIITTSGGGMLVSKRAEALERARFLATQAKEPFPYYHHRVKGYNYRLSNVLAGIGRGQLRVINERIRRKREIFDLYAEQLGELSGVAFLQEEENAFSNRWLTVCFIDEKENGIRVEELLSYLEEENIEARHVWKPLHLQPLFKDFPFFPHSEKEPVSEKVFSRGVCLPSGTNLTVDDQMRVIHCLKRKLEKQR